MDKRLKDYYDGVLPPDEELEVQKWLAANGDDEALDGNLLDLFESEYSACSAKPAAGFRASGTVRRYSSGFVAAISAACILAVAAIGTVSFLIGRGTSDNVVASVEWIEYKVPVGSNQRLVLSDSTELFLNAGTRITYPSVFTGDERKIFVDGEVFAHVKSDPEHPFIISAGDTKLKVYGTTFNYKAYDDNDCVEVLLFDGSVNLDVNVGKEERSVKMSPGYMVQYERKTGAVDMQTFDRTSYRPFSDSRSLHFFNLTMRDIALDLTRYFGTRIVVMDEKLANTHFLAYFTNNETLDQILSSMNTDRKMKITRKDGVVYLKSNK